MVALALGGCSGDDETPPADDDRVVLEPAAPGEGHTHAPGAQPATVGDGTTAAAGGYRLVDVRLPTYTGQPGPMSFRIVDPSGRPLTKYTEEQTKLLHLYVVREDLQEFRHLHPTLAKDGTWSTRVNLGQPGSYRVLAEFTPGTSPDGDHVVLGETVAVPGRWQPAPPEPGTTDDDGLVEVSAPETVESGADQRMTLTVRAVDGGAPTLGTYLGSYAHLTGFAQESGGFVHVHQLGAPEDGSDGAELVFHTDFRDPGRYLLFVQVRLDGFVHTVPVTTTVV